MAAVPVVSKTCNYLLGCGLIKVGHRDVGAFPGQPSGTGPADTVPSTGDCHHSAGEASKLSLLLKRSLPLSSNRRFTKLTDPNLV
jgi:hypothetical protein